MSSPPDCYLHDDGPSEEEVVWASIYNYLCAENTDAQRQKYIDKKNKQLPSLPDDFSSKCSAVIEPECLSPTSLPAELTKLPAEIWSSVCWQLSVRHRKTLATSCRFFREIARPVLWHEPCFQKVVDINDLHALAVYQPPIRLLKLYQFGYENAFDESIRDLVDLLLNSFQLSGFVIENGDRFGYSMSLTETQLECLLQLPVSTLNTHSLCLSVSPDKLIQLLNKQQQTHNSCPSIVIHERFHAQLTLDHWADMTKFPIVEINARFSDHNIDLRQYDRIVGQIRPPPDYHLGNPLSKELYPDDIRQFQCVRITKLNLATVSPSQPIQRLVDALVANNQRPRLTLPPRELNRFPIDTADLQLLFQFDIDQIHTSFLYVHKHSVDRFTDMLVKKHRDTGIKKLILDSAQAQTYFRHTQLQKLVEAGLINVTRRTYNSLNNT